MISVGLNPSYPSFERLDAAFIAEHGLNAENYITQFQWNTSGLADAYDPTIANRLSLLHSSAKNYYPFFHRMRLAAQVLHSPQYEHVDLFLRLDANSKSLPADHWKAKNHKHSLDPNFVQAQLDIAYEVIIRHQPEVLLCVYASAADILFRHLKSRGLELDRGWSKIDNKLCISTSRINLTPGRSKSVLVRWPSFPKNCRGSMSEADFTGALQKLKNWLWRLREKG
jgi:hypothetical protein